MEIKVKNSKLIKIQSFNSENGNLFIAEHNNNIPFTPKRVYFTNNLSKKSEPRGNHAHKKFEQIIFCTNGSFTLKLDDGKNRQTIILDDPSTGVYLGPKLWHSMENFSDNCVILVLAKDYYNEDDYLRDYEDFLEYIKNN